MLSKTDWKEIYWSIVYWSNSHVFTACTGGTSAASFCKLMKFRKWTLRRNYSLFMTAAKAIFAVVST